MRMRIEPTPTGGARILTEELILELTAEAVSRIATLHPMSVRDSVADMVVLPEEHPMWDHYSGGNRHGGHPWQLPADVDGARRLRRYVSEMLSGIFFEMLLAAPGRLFTSQEIMEAHPDAFSSANAVAGCLTGFVKLTEELGRPFPFFWWKGVNGAPSRYAIRPSVAAVFAAAGD